MDDQEGASAIGVAGQVTELNHASEVDAVGPAANGELPGMSVVIEQRTTSIHDLLPTTTTSETFEARTVRSVGSL